MSWKHLDDRTGEEVTPDFQVQKCGALMALTQNSHSKHVWLWLRCHIYQWSWNKMCFAVRAAHWGSLARLQEVTAILWPLRCAHEGCAVWKRVNQLNWPWSSQREARFAHANAVTEDAIVRVSSEVQRIRLKLSDNHKFTEMDLTRVYTAVQSFGQTRAELWFSLIITEWWI